MSPSISTFSALALSLFLLCSTVIESGCAPGAPAASSTNSPPITATRGAPCDRPDQLAYGEAEKVLLVCGVRGDGNPVWGVAGIDKPITAKATLDATCPRTGTLGVAASGMILVCKDDSAGLTPDGAAGRP